MVRPQELLSYLLFGESVRLCLFNLLAFFENPGIATWLCVIEISIMPNMQLDWHRKTGWHFFDVGTSGRSMSLVRIKVNRMSLRSFLKAFGTSTIIASLRDFKKRSNTKSRRDGNIVELIKQFHLNPEGVILPNFTYTNIEYLAAENVQFSTLNFQFSS